MNSLQGWIGDRKLICLAALLRIVGHRCVWGGFMLQQKKESDDCCHRTLQVSISLSEKSAVQQRGGCVVFPSSESFSRFVGFCLRLVFLCRCDFWFAGN